MKNIRSGRGYKDVNQVLRVEMVLAREVDRVKGGRRKGNECIVSHLAQERDHLGSREGKSRTRVDVRLTGDEGSRREYGSEVRAGTSGRAGRVDDPNGLDAALVSHRRERGRTDVKGSAQYSENMVTSTSRT